MVNKNDWLVKGIFAGGQATIIGALIFYFLTHIFSFVRTNWLEQSPIEIFFSFGVGILFSIIFVMIPSLVIALIPNLIGGILLTYTITKATPKLIYSILLGTVIGLVNVLILIGFVSYLYDFEWFKRGGLEAIQGFFAWVIAALLSAIFAGGYIGYKVKTSAMANEQLATLVEG